MRLLLVVGGMLALAVSALTPAIASHFTPLQVQWHRFPPSTGDLFRAYLQFGVRNRAVEHRQAAGPHQLYT